MRRPASTVERATFRPPPGGPPIQVGEKLTFGKVLPPLHHLSSVALHNGLRISSPISPQGSENAFRRLFLAGCAGPGDLGTAGNFFNVSQAHFHVRPDDGVPRRRTTLGRDFTR